MKTFLASRLSINRSLVPIKFHYFVFFAAIACALPFRTVYAKQLGISGSATGIIFATMSLSRLLTNPVLGAILDRFKRFRLTLMTTVVLVAAPNVAMIFISPISDYSSHSFKTLINYTCNVELLQFELSKTHLTEQQLVNNTQTCQMYCNFSLVSIDNRTEGNNSSPSQQQCQNHTLHFNYNDIVFKIYKNVTELEVIEDANIILTNQSKNKRTAIGLCNIDKYNFLTKYGATCSSCGEMQCVSTTCSSYQAAQQPVEDTLFMQFSTHQFWVFLFLMTLSTSSLSAVIFIMDAVCYEILDRKPEKYGLQRLYGTMGWGLGALIGGYFNQLFTGDADIIDYSPCFYLLAGLCALDLLPIWYVELKNVKYSPSIWKDVKSLLSKPYVLVYIIMVFFVGVLSGLIWNYQFWFMEEIGASQLLLGLSQTFECFLAEVPCFIVAGWVIKKIGYMNCNSLTFFFFGLRYICFFYMFDPWWSLPAGLLHGPTFGLFFTSMTAFAKDKAPPGTEATAQAILSVAFESVGVAIGSFFGGIGFDVFGSRTTFLYAAISSFALLLINFIVHYFIRQQQTDQHKKVDSKPETDLNGMKK